MDAQADSSLDSGRWLSIGEVSRATGLSESNIRAWERRHGFPRSERTTSGHRRYSPAELDRIQRVLDERKRGIGIGVAIDRVRAMEVSVPSFYASLRGRHDLQTMRMRKPHLLGLSQAIEDESLARAERGVLVGAFQRERFYRQSEGRWRELCRGAAAALVFADFERKRTPPEGPVEVPLERTHPLNREWALVWLAPEHVACLIGWEPPGSETGRDDAREFEACFTLEPAVAREAAAVAASVAERTAPEVARSIRAEISTMVEPSAVSQLRLAAAITARTMARLT